jgi:hypothetical protein
MLWTMCCGTTPAAENVPGDSMAVWLRADRAGKVDETGGVRVWENRAPGAIGHAVQDEVARRPRSISSVPSLGGQPALEFDGKDDFLHLPWLRIGSQTTVILVAENTEQSEGGSYWRALLSGDDDSFRDGATKYAFSFRRAGFDPLFIANLYYAPDKPHRLMQPASPPTSSGFHIYSFRRQGEATDGMTLRVDGATVARMTADKNPPAFPGVGYTIGQGGNVTAGKVFRFYRGRIAEILIYDSPLATIEMLQVEEYLAEKYNLIRQDAPPTRGLVLMRRKASSTTWPTATSRLRFIQPAREEGRPVAHRVLLQVLRRSRCNVVSGALSDPHPPDCPGRPVPRNQRLERVPTCGSRRQRARLLHAFWRQQAESGPRIRVPVRQFADRARPAEHSVGDAPGRRLRDSH